MIRPIVSSSAEAPSSRKYDVSGRASASCSIAYQDRPPDRVRCPTASTWSTASSAGRREERLSGLTMAIGPRDPLYVGTAVTVLSLGQPLHRGGERVAPVGIAGEHVHRRAPRGQQDRVTR